MAEYSDWELHTDSLNTLQNAVKTLGFTQGDGYLKGVRYSIYIYGQKFAPTGNTFPGPVPGSTLPEMAPLPGYYAIMRWWSPDPFPPPGVHLPNGVTAVPLPADSPVVFSS